MVFINLSTSHCKYYITQHIFKMYLNFSRRQIFSQFYRFYNFPSIYLFLYKTNKWRPIIMFSTAIRWKIDKNFKLDNEGQLLPWWSNALFLEVVTWTATGNRFWKGAEWRVGLQTHQLEKVVKKRRRRGLVCNSKQRNMTPRNPLRIKRDTHEIAQKKARYFIRLPILSFSPLS